MSLSREQKPVNGWLVGTGIVLAGAVLAGGAIGIVALTQKKEEPKKRGNGHRHHDRIPSGGGRGENIPAQASNPGPVRAPRGTNDGILAVGQFDSDTKMGVPIDFDGPYESYDADRKGECDLDPRRLFPAGGGWRGDGECQAGDSSDAFGEYGPKASAFQAFIASGGSASFGLNTRTKSPVGGVTSLRDMFVGGPPVPLGNEQVLFGDSSHRNDLIQEATGHWPVSAI